MEKVIAACRNIEESEETASLAGFESSSRFYENSKQWLAMKPSDYRRGGTGQQIHFGIASCSLGFVLLGVTSKGICSIDLGDDSNSLESPERDSSRRYKNLF